MARISMTVFLLLAVAAAPFGKDAVVRAGAPWADAFAAALLLLAIAFTAATMGFHYVLRYDRAAPAIGRYAAPAKS